MHLKQNTRYSLTTLILAATAIASSLAAAEELPVYDLEHFVVVSTRTPLSMERVSPSVDFISQETMEFWQDHNLTDVLGRQPGMTVITAGAVGGQTSLFTRGTESNHTGLFLDGRRLNTGFGNQYDLELLSLENLSSVQIQRGASSVNYGSSGIGGVVDLRTRNSLAANANKGSVAVEIGSNDYRRSSIDYVLTSDSYGFSVSGSELSTNNERPNDGYEKTAVTPRFDYKIADNFYFEVLAQYTESEKELPGSTATPTLNRVQQNMNYLLSPGIRYLSDELSLHFFYARSYSELEDQAGGPRDIVEVESDELNLQVDYSVNEGVLLTAGAVYRDDEAYDSNIAFAPPPVSYQANFQQIGAYGQILARLTDALELRAALRYDDYSEFDDKATGGVEAIYHIAPLKLSVFAKAATSFAPPSALDIAFDGDPVGTPLQAEESQSYEIGFRHRAFDEKLTWSLLYFRNEIDELLDFVFVPPFTFDSINVKEATTDGMEFKLDYQHTDSLGFSVGYTYLTAYDESAEQRLLRRPRHTLQLSTTYQFTDALRAGLHGVGYFDREDSQITAPFGRTEHEDQFVVRLVVDWDIDANWTIFARAENLLDEEYAPTVGFPALGRTGYIGVKYRF